MAAGQRLKLCKIRNSVSLPGRSLYCLSSPLPEEVSLLLNVINSDLVLTVLVGLDLVILILMFV